MDKTQTAPPYLIIGSGRLARHITHYLELLELPFVQWNRHETKEKLYTFSTQATHILFLIKDEAIHSFLEKHQTLFHDKTKIHCSGALTIDNCHCAHPLMTFSNDLYPEETYQKIPFILDNPDIPFNALFPGLSNPHYFIPKELKAYYHALCVISGNFTVLLWQKFANELNERFGIPDSAYHSYLRQTAENLLSNPKSALTGPIARGDHETIFRHLETLNRMQDPFYSVYQAFLTTQGASS